MTCIVHSCHIYLINLENVTTATIANNAENKAEESIRKLQQVTKSRKVYKIKIIEEKSFYIYFINKGLCWLYENKLKFQTEMEQYVTNTIELLGIIYIKLYWLLERNSYS